MIHVAVGPEPFDVAAALDGIERAGAGAVASFTGLVRADDGVETLTLEHYPGVTEAVLRTIAEQAAVRWALLAVTVLHRVGPMAPGDRIVFVGTAAPHRGAALDACAAIMDRLKTEAPFWKRERRADGDRWVEARTTDADAAARWVSAAGDGTGEGQRVRR